MKGSNLRLADAVGTPTLNLHEVDASLGSLPEVAATPAPGLTETCLIRPFLPFHSLFKAAMCRAQIPSA